MGVEPFLLCSSVLGIIGQRLLRKVCESCKESYAIPEELIKKLHLRDLSSERDIKFYRGKGCPKCLSSGYKGRVGIIEIMVLSPKIKELILDHAGEYELKQAARLEGMKTMRENGLIKALAGLTSLEEVLRVTAPDEELEKK